jgi:hypothetical protein
MSTDQDPGPSFTELDPEDNGFELRTLVLFKKHLDPEFAALYAHVEVDCVEISNTPADVRPEVMFQLLRGLVEDCGKLQKIAFDRFLRLLSLERISSTPQQARCLLWATERLAGC